MMLKKEQNVSRETKITKIRGKNVSRETKRAYVHQRLGEAKKH